jgi:hypothetical protein
LNDVNPIASAAANDGFRCARPILQIGNERYRVTIAAAESRLNT